MCRTFLLKKINFLFEFEYIGKILNLMETKSQELIPKVTFDELVVSTVKIIEKLEKETGIRCVVSIDESKEHITISQK